MAQTLSWTVEGLDELADSFEKVRKAAPDLFLKQINRAGNKFRRECIEETQEKVVTRKGNLVKGYRKKVVQTIHDGGFDYEAQITGGNRKARHFHLIENGHRQVAGNFYKKGYGYAKAKAGYVKGYKMVETVRSRWSGENLLLKYAQAAIKEALKKGMIE